MNDDLEQLFSCFPADGIENSGDTIYVVGPDFQLIYFNQGWSAFASENAGEPAISRNWSIGCCVLDAIPPAIRPFFEENFTKCIRESRPWEHQYECSSPEAFRRFVMHCLPLSDGKRLLIVHSLVQDAPRTLIEHQRVESLYRDEDGIITQCCHCRRVRRKEIRLTWDWVTEWVKTIPPKTSHGLCEICFGFYYNIQNDPDAEFPKTFRTTD